MAKKYKAPDGCVLAIDCHEEGWCIGWELPDGEGIEVYLGELREEDLKDADDWDMRAAQEAVQPFADFQDADDYNRFVFGSKRKAQQALKLANEVLLRGDERPWPDWAVKAKAEGWMPPEGWRP